MILTNFNSENIEEETIKIYSEQNPSDLNALVPELLNVLSIDKQEGEKTDSFTSRIMDGAKKVLKF